VINEPVIGNRLKLLSSLAFLRLITGHFLNTRFLKRELNGYDAYTKKVRYRLIPFIW
jgi:protein-S-isoprenylcysteine O-methyltransferase Ste14